MPRNRSAPHRCVGVGHCDESVWGTPILRCKVQRNYDAGRLDSEVPEVFLKGMPDLSKQRDFAELVLIYERNRPIFTFFIGCYIFFCIFAINREDNRHSL